MRLKVVLVVGLSAWLSACSPSGDPAIAEVAQPVRTFAPVVSAAAQITLSGIVRSRTEVALGFEVNGRVQQRLVDAGAVVTAGQPLIQLNDVDLRQNLQAQQALLVAAHANESNAQAELNRLEQLVANQLATIQQRDQAQLLFAQATQQRVAQQAQLALAEKAVADTLIVAPADGVIVDFLVEKNQVVNRGQTVANFAYANEAEIEVLLPPQPQPSLEAFQQAYLVGLDGSKVMLELRETAGSLSTSGRTLRARYRVDGDLNLPLQSVVKVEFSSSQQATWIVPLSALDGRCAKPSANTCEHPQVWQVTDEKAYPVAVTVQRFDGEYAHIQGPIRASTQVIAAGTHMLKPGIEVRVLPQ